MASNLSAAVLIGGRSRRMGEPKALLRLSPAHPTLLETIVKTVGEIASDVVLVGRTDWPIPAALVDLRHVEDDGNGAADGVIAALETARFNACLVVGCDMPFLDVALLREMAELAEREQRGVVARDASGMHALHAIWRRDDLAWIEAMVAGGERSLGAIATTLAMATVDLETRDEPARWSVFNANTPEELEVARSRVPPVADDVTAYHGSGETT